MNVVIPMMPGDPEERIREQGVALLKRVREWIADKGGAPTGFYPLPWYATERSPQLEFVGAELEKEFTIRITLEPGCLGLRLTPKEASK